MSSNVGDISHIIKKDRCSTSFPMSFIRVAAAVQFGIAVPPLPSLRPGTGPCKSGLSRKDVWENVIKIKKAVNRPQAKRNGGTAIPSWTAAATLVKDLGKQVRSRSFSCRSYTHSHLFALDHSCTDPSRGVGRATEGPRYQTGRRLPPWWRT